MKTSISLLIASAFAAGSVCASADPLYDLVKQHELSTIVSTGNPNAPARGEAIAESAASAQQPIADAKILQQDLDRIISSGNPNASARGVAIARSAESAHG